MRWADIIKMKYNPIRKEREWWGIGEEKSRKSKELLPAKHHFAHTCVRSKLYDALLALGCNKDSSILEVGCGSGEDVIYVSKASKNIVGVDIVPAALKGFASKSFRFQGILAGAKELPFHSNSFDYVISSGLLHHLIGQGDLQEYLREFGRVTRGGT